MNKITDREKIRFFLKSDPDFYETKTIVSGYNRIFIFNDKGEITKIKEIKNGRER
jgi:hypothetical protein